MKRWLKYRITFHPDHNTNANHAAMVKGLVSSQYACAYSPRFGGQLTVTCRPADLVHMTDCVLAYCGELESVTPAKRRLGRMS